MQGGFVPCRCVELWDKVLDCSKEKKKGGYGGGFFRPESRHYSDSFSFLHECEMQFARPTGCSPRLLLGKRAYSDDLLDVDTSRYSSLLVT